MPLARSYAKTGVVQCKGRIPTQLSCRVAVLFTGRKVSTSGIGITCDDYRHEPWDLKQVDQELMCNGRETLPSGI